MSDTGNVGVETPVDCATEVADSLTSIRAKVAGVQPKCKDTTDLLRDVGLPRWLVR